MKNLRGIYPALVTPMNSDSSVNFKVLGELAKSNIGKGVTGLYLGGSTAESFLLTKEERKKILETVAAEVGGKLNIIVHTGSLSTAEAIDLSRHAKSCGADAVSSVPPIYFKYTFKEIIRYYLDIMDASGMPLVIYNVPAFTGVSFTQANAREIFAHPLTVGIKHTSVNMYDLERIRSANPHLVIFNGYDEVFLSGLSMGADAIIGSTVNFMADKFIAMKILFESGKPKEAESIQQRVNTIIEVMSGVGMFNSVKYALSLQGFECGECRRPFQPLTDVDKAKVKAVLDTNL